MLTTIIYRSHFRDDVPVTVLEDMVVAANEKNKEAGVSGILLFTGKLFFQLLEGPEENVRAIYRAICEDPRHHNVVELLCDYSRARRFGKYGMELFDLRHYDRHEVLQNVLDKGTTKYQMFYNDRALHFFRTFVEESEKENYFELPSGDHWVFVPDSDDPSVRTLPGRYSESCSFAFQPIIDPLAREVVSLEALIRTPEGEPSQRWFEGLEGDAVYEADLKSKSVAFAMAKELGLGEQSLSVNLLPMTLVNIPNAVDYLIREIEANGLVAEQIVVEFTEHEVISRLDEFTGAVRELKAAGIGVAIDHFGGGFAGLLLLAQFQPDRIKINRDLIRDVHKSGPRQAIVLAIIKCCTALEILISAVGIEQPEEWMWLESAGVSQFQGHLFAHPELAGIPPVSWPEPREEVLL
ncbi:MULTISPECIES: diguanylate phosphodiesterase [unclassified Leclercia]|uniref:Diguanylate phosphodiesterase n=1 Tax=Leclercia barmai TaxID=2785629 RepID=A0ABS7RRZ3_9ENTR|nr:MULTISPECIES: diguanylate phosphodiesterase [unclassified Leclercia]MBZ0056600.1 diguanylate phosphodiesterase [Leclercia sp. EMC7]MCM5694560.1 diguanylate phosphodiesterase [Leclercia sp. LTM01]MCM5699055.1 diguanylate phosphodiesterase [Leclercia sp. LTM14]